MVLSSAMMVGCWLVVLRWRWVVAITALCVFHHTRERPKVWVVVAIKKATWRCAVALPHDLGSEVPAAALCDLECTGMAHAHTVWLWGPSLGNQTTDGACHSGSVWVAISW